jgi:predicted transcriptional regulator
MVAALVHLEPGLKRRLAQRARQRGTSFSQEVREAVSLYLELPPATQDELAALAAAANQSLDRTITKLEDTIAEIDGVLRRIGKRR